MFFTSKYDPGYSHCDVVGEASVENTCMPCSRAGSSAMLRISLPANATGKVAEDLSTWVLKTFVGQLGGVLGS